MRAARAGGHPPPHTLRSTSTVSPPAPATVASISLLVSPPTAPLLQPLISSPPISPPIAPLPRRSWSARRPPATRRRKRPSGSRQKWRDVLEAPHLATRAALLRRRLEAALRSPKLTDVAALDLQAERLAASATELRANLQQARGVAAACEAGAAEAVTLRKHLDDARAGWREALQASSAAMLSSEVEHNQRSAILAAEMLQMDAQLATLRERADAGASTPLHPIPSRPTHTAQAALRAPATCFVPLWPAHSRASTPLVWPTQARRWASSRHAASGGRPTHWRLP